MATINLSPPEFPLPRRGRIPYNHAWRWRSPVEVDEPETAVKVFVSPRAYVRFCAHAGSDLYNEVGGWLIGKWRVDRTTDEEFIVVESTLPARFTRHGGTFLTFTQDSQVALQNDLESRFPGKELVGWYHTHPRMGVFLSHYDAWLHQNFFPTHYQVALVIEPYTAAGGFFVRRSDGELDPRRYYGFYELNHRSRRSVVHWRNMLPEMERVSV